MAEFQKVTFEQFKKTCQSLEAGGALWFTDDNEIKAFYDAIQLPRRATGGSAGYDFCMPFPATFISANPVMIPTGIRVLLNPDQFLLCVPRSGLGFKYGARLVNTCGIIDSDYAGSDNEGHIMAKICCDKPFRLDSGDRFMQGIIMKYDIVDNDEPIKNERNGGFGSTGGETHGN